MPKRAAWTADDLELIDVAAAGDVGRVRALLPSANLRAADKTDATALIKAARYGNAECVKLLLKGSFVPKCDRYGLDALMWAASGGHTECVRLLLPRSKPLAQIGQGDTALTSAAYGGHLECVQQLAPVSDIQASGTMGRTALLAAADKGHIQIVRLLLSMGADIFALNIHKHNALMAAASCLSDPSRQKGSPAQCVQAILNVMPDDGLLNTDRHGNTAFKLALRSGNLDCADILAFRFPRAHVDQVCAELDVSQTALPAWSARLEAEQLRASLIGDAIGRQEVAAVRSAAPAKEIEKEKSDLRASKAPRASLGAARRI